MIVADSYRFLPLSFFTSLFGINAREWSGEPTNLTLATMLEIAGKKAPLMNPTAFLFADKLIQSAGFFRHHCVVPSHGVQ